MKSFYLFLILSVSTANLHAQVGIGTTSPSPASMLEISSRLNNENYVGLMPPRVTVEQRDFINAQESDLGLLVFVNDPVNQIYCIQVWNGTAWENIKCLSNSKSPTEVEYTVVAGQNREDSGTVDLEFNIFNPSPDNAVNITISASSYNDFTESTAKVVTIPAGEETFISTAVFNILNDGLTEGNEVVDLTITNISGGSGAATIGENDQYNLTIIDDDIKLWINEIHYDNDGGDENERVEIAGSAGVDLTGYTILHYNGSDGKIIAPSTIDISGSIPNKAAGLGTLSFYTSLQNGVQEGLALVDPSGEVIQFLSYEGTVTATNGPANGTESTDINVMQDNAPVGTSLQLQGTGNSYADFTWAANIVDTIGEVNDGQVFN